MKYHKNMFRKKKDLCMLKTVTKPFSRQYPLPEEHFPVLKYRNFLDCSEGGLLD